MLEETSCTRTHCGKLCVAPNSRTKTNSAIRRLPPSSVDFIFFADEKIFTVAPPVNLQNDRVYVPTRTKEREVAADRRLRTRPTFSKSIMVSVSVSKLGCSGLLFMEQGTKVNGAYYREELLSKQLLPAIRRIAGDTFVFQQDSTPSHRARVTIDDLKRRLIAAWSGIHQQVIDQAIDQWRERLRGCVNES